MLDKKALNFYAVIVGSFFIISGVGKLMDIAAFSNLLYQYGFGYLMILSPLIVWIEIALGLLLILLINPKLNSLFSFVLLLIFTLSFAYGHYKHGVNDCGCLGTLQPVSIPPVFTFMRNFILLSMSLAVGIKYPKTETEVSRWKKPVIFIFLFISAFIAGLTSVVPAVSRAGISPAKFNYQNQDINKTNLSKYIKTSPGKKYLIFCFSFGCPHCWNSMENLKQYKKNKTVDTIVAFAVDENADKHFFYQHFNLDFPVSDLSDNAMQTLTDRYPTAFYVEDDTIKVVLQSELPSPVTFEKYYNSKIHNNFKH